MTTYRMNQRLSYLPGGALRVAPGAWPDLEPREWWEPAGSFTCVAAYKAKGAATLAASYVNLANPGTYDAAPGTAPTFNTATGWTFNGATQYLTTGINPSGTNKAYSMLVRYDNFNPALIANSAFIGMFNGGTDSLLLFSAGNNRLVAYSSGSYDTGVGNYTYGSGVVALAGDKAYYNGTSLGTISSGSNLASIAITIASTGASRYFLGRIQAVAIYSTALTAAQVDTVSDAMAAL